MCVLLFCREWSRALWGFPGWFFWLFQLSLPSSTSHMRQRKCPYWTLPWSWVKHATSPREIYGLCGAKKIPLTSMWWPCWWMKRTPKASLPMCAISCPGLKSTGWCLGTARTRKPSPRFWILFPLRLWYPFWGSMAARPWSWRIRSVGR